jgi:hypothetical protein
MMKKLLSLLLLLTAAACHQPQTTFTSQDWTEPADPNETDMAAWTDVQKPLASWGSVDVRYALSEPFSGESSEIRLLKGWRGERVHAQVVVSTPKDIRNLKCRLGEFRSDDGSSLDAGIARARFVKYVLSDYFNHQNACGARAEGEPSRLMPDLLSEEISLDVAANSTRPVWITVDIPHDAKPGLYSTSIKVTGKGFSQSLNLDLEVLGRTLPPPSEWAFHLDLWQHPSAVARVEGVPVWSDAHFEALRSMMKMLADAGQKVITATLNKEPWNNQCYDPYADMIIWTKHPDGSWEYDFSAFDRWVELMTELGVTQMINCYSMLPWNNILHYRDGATGKFVDVEANPGTPAFTEMWEPFLPAFVAHLRERGWLERTNIAMDERSPEQMAEATALLARVAPELGIALADNHNSYKRYPYIKDMCASIFSPIEHSDIELRRQMGLNTTFYVCCSSDFPNTYTFSDPAEATYLAWHAAAYDYDGFLRWTYNSWTEDPIRDARFRTWASGDTSIVYPEGRSSIRFERLREGIQDFEKLHILQAEMSGDESAAARFRELVAPFKAANRDWSWNAALNRAKQTINEM